MTRYGETPNQTVAADGSTFSPAANATPDAGIYDPSTTYSPVTATPSTGASPSDAGIYDPSTTYSPVTATPSTGASPSDAFDPNSGMFDNGGNQQGAGYGVIGGSSGAPVGTSTTGTGNYGDMIPPGPGSGGDSVSPPDAAGALTPATGNCVMSTPAPQSGAKDTGGGTPIDITDPTKIASQAGDTISKATGQLGKDIGTPAIERIGFHLDPAPSALAQFAAQRRSMRPSSTRLAQGRGRRSSGAAFTLDPAPSALARFAGGRRSGGAACASPMAVERRAPRSPDHSPGTRLMRPCPSAAILSGSSAPSERRAAIGPHALSHAPSPSVQPTSAPRPWRAWRTAARAEYGIQIGSGLIFALRCQKKETERETAWSLFLFIVRPAPIHYREGYTTCHI
jgi:hypothetical protein